MVCGRVGRHGLRIVGGDLTRYIQSSKQTLNRRPPPKTDMKQPTVKSISAITILFAILVVTTAKGDLRHDALHAAKNAVSFMTEHLSIEGGYLWKHSADLELREGEGVVTTRTAWVQPPGTPSVGGAFLQLYAATNDKQFLEAARNTGEALRRGQMRSGGWQSMIEFESARRRKWAYRTDPIREKAKDQSSLDDDKTQSALRFVMQLDQALLFEDEAIHEMALYALDGLLAKGQSPNGGFPQVWTNAVPERETTAKVASYPESWPREYPGHREYWYRYTLNDNLAPDVIRTLFLAEEIYSDVRYREAALKHADFLLLIQMPDPQPAWAQQYDYDLHPIWARKFEPPAVTGGESQGVIETLMYVYTQTQNAKYIETLPKALDYLEASALPDGRLARFYELETNRPLYFTKSYELTYDDSDLPTHYSFKTTSRVPRMRSELKRLTSLTEAGVVQERKTEKAKVSDRRVRGIIDGLDERGAWVSNGELRYHKKSGPVIDLRIAVSNLKLLANYLKHGKETATLDR